MARRAVFPFLAPQAVSGPAFFSEARFGELEANVDLDGALIHIGQCCRPGNDQSADEQAAIQLAAVAATKAVTKAKKKRVKKEHEKRGCDCPCAGHRPGRR